MIERKICHAILTIALVSSISPALILYGRNLSKLEKKILPVESNPPEEKSVRLEQALEVKDPGTSWEGLEAEFDTMTSLTEQGFYKTFKISDQILVQACSYLRTPYRWGHSLRNGRGTDCSAFVQFIFRKANINLPRVSIEQAQVGKTAAHNIDYAKLMAGDLLFFSRGRRHIGHVGIYLGEGKMIHASSGAKCVTVTDLSTPYYQKHFVVAKRIPAVQQPALN